MKKLFYLAIVCCLFTATLQAKNVSVTIFPTDAKVLEKGQVIAPASVGVYSIPVGLVDHIYTVQCDGYDPQSFVVNMKSSQQMQINLKPNRKQVSITTDPATATIYIDGRESGQGVVDFTINKGETKSIKCVCDGYDNYIKQVGFDDQSDIKMSYNIPLIQNRREVTIIVDAKSAEFFYDGKPVGKGSGNVSFPIYKGKDAELIVKAEGFLNYHRILSFHDNTSSYNLTKELAIDEAYAQSESGAKIANIRTEFIVKKDMKREDAIMRMKYTLSENFGSLEINDNISGWYRTVWVMEKFAIGTIRTRAELKEKPDNGDGKLVYKFVLQSQISSKDHPQDEDFVDWDRVLKKYSGIEPDLRNSVGE